MIYIGIGVLIGLVLFGAAFAYAIGRMVDDLDNRE